MHPEGSLSTGIVSCCKHGEQHGIDPGFPSPSPGTFLSWDVFVGVKTYSHVSLKQHHTDSGLLTVHQRRRSTDHTKGGQGELISPSGIVNSPDRRWKVPQGHQGRHDPKTMDISSGSARHDREIGNKQTIKESLEVDREEGKGLCIIPHILHRLYAVWDWQSHNNNNLPNKFPAFIGVDMDPGFSQVLISQFWYSRRTRENLSSSSRLLSAWRYISLCRKSLGKTESVTKISHY